MNRLTVRSESAGNATIHNRKGEVVAVIEDWSLFVDGKRIADVDSYRDAITITEKVLTK